MDPSKNNTGTFRELICMRVHNLVQFDWIKGNYTFPFFHSLYFCSFLTQQFHSNKLRDTLWSRINNALCVFIQSVIVVSSRLSPEMHSITLASCACGKSQNNTLNSEEQK